MTDRATKWTKVLCITQKQAASVYTAR